LFYAKTISPQNLGQDFSQAASLAYADNNWAFSIKEQWVGEHYNPEVGYVPRVNFLQLQPEIGKIFYPKINTTNVFIPP